MSIRLLALLLLLAPAGLVPTGSAQGRDDRRGRRADPAPTLETPVVEVPMDDSDGHVSIDVSIGAGEPHAFHLDTYALYPACVDRRFAERMGFERIGSVTNGDGSGALRRLETVLIPELRLGGATFTNVRALVDDYSFVPAVGGGSIDGLLGYPLFRELLLELDYPAGVVRLSAEELERNEAGTISHRTLRRRPDFLLEIGDERLWVGVDSGATSALMLPQSMVGEFHLEGRLRYLGRAQTVYTKAVLRGAVLGEPVRFGDEVRTGVLATFSELFGKPLVGHALLEHYAVAFDQRNGRLRFRRPATTAQPSSGAETLR